MKKFNRAQESGRSMIEMLGVLAIVGVLSVGGISGYSKAMGKYKINQCLDQIANLIINIRSTFANQTDFSGATTANIIALGIATNDMLNAQGNALVNPFNGAINVKATDGGAASFEITYAGLDTSACQNIALADWGAAASSGLVSIKINNTTYQWADSSLPISVADAAGSCGQAGNGNSITWTYR